LGIAQEWEFYEVEDIHIETFGVKEKGRYFVKKTTDSSVEYHNFEFLFSLHFHRTWVLLYFVEIFF
jgi:hypothetical protein